MRVGWSAGNVIQIAVRLAEHPENTRSLISSDRIENRMHNTEALNASITPAAVVGSVSLPTATVEAVEVLPQQEAKENSSNQDLLKTSRIMIVDDEQLVIRVVRRFLSSDGYNNFLTLTDPRDAMEQMKSYQPDIVLLDIMMPHLSGINILKLHSRMTGSSIFRSSYSVPIRRNPSNGTR